MLEKAKEMERRFEGLRLIAYLCPGGFFTIGYGHTKNVKHGDFITPIQAEFYLDADTIEAANAALQLSPILALYPAKLAAITDFIFNLGASRYRISTLRKKVDAQEWGAAAKELSKWVWGGGRKLPGLVIRRAVESSYLLGRE